MEGVGLFFAIIGLAWIIFVIQWMLDVRRVLRLINWNLLQLREAIESDDEDEEEPDQPV
jgi:hypothetical protein